MAMAMLSNNVRNLKFMNNQKIDKGKVEEKTFSFYACKNVINNFDKPKENEKSTSFKFNREFSSSDNRTRK